MKNQVQKMTPNQRGLGTQDKSFQIMAKFFFNVLSTELGENQKLINGNDQNIWNLLTC